MGLSGLEPPTSRLSGVRSNQLSYKPIFQKLKAFEWRWRDSNSRPPACKAGALPTELHPHLIWRPPTLPHRLQCSTIGRLGLNRRVRDGNGCVPQAHRHQKFRDTKVSAQSREKGCWKLASIKTFYQGCICDAVATKELLFRGSLTHLNT